MYKQNFQNCTMDTLKLTIIQMQSGYWIQLININTMPMCIFNKYLIKDMRVTEQKTLLFEFQRKLTGCV